MENKQKIIIANFIDWSMSFVDENGAFYCGTTLEQKENAAKIGKLADLVIVTTDIHPVTAPEHKINNGLYPVHNAVLPERYNEDFVYMLGEKGEKLRLENKTLSPRLTDVLEKGLENREKGIIAPRGVYFQAGLKEPFCKPEDIEKTFDAKIITPEQFVALNIDHIIAPKQYFDATRLDSDIALPEKQFDGIPRANYNVYSLINEVYPREKYEVVHVNTGVVEGICRLHTSIGLRQMFPFDEIINVEDATTPLHGVGLGYNTKEESREACKKVCKDIGIEYITTEEIIKKFRNREEK